jgi:hypothetical protein
MEDFSLVLMFLHIFVIDYRCFPAEARANMADGSYKRMDDLAIGDSIVSVAADGRLIVDKVMWW